MELNKFRKLSIRKKNMIMKDTGSGLSLYAICDRYDIGPAHVIHIMANYERDTSKEDWFFKFTKSPQRKS